MFFEVLSLTYHSPITMVRVTCGHTYRRGPLLTPLSTFGRPLEAGLARQFQLSIDFEF